MYPKNMFFTSESVTEGHPDKFCDQISDVVLDECLKQDPLSRVACECYVTMDLLAVGGEVTTKAMFDAAKVAREFAKLSEEILATLLRKVFPLSLHGIIDHLNLREPVYRNTAAYGLFGRSEFAWEKVDATEELLAGARNA